MITTFATIVLVFAMLIGVALIIRRTTRAQAAALEEETPGAEATVPSLTSPALEGA